MPTYRFQCDSCEGFYEELFMSYDCPSQLKCECGGVLNKTIKGIIPNLKFVGRHWPDRERKLDEHMDWVDRVRAEPVCNSEIDEGKDMMREREKEKGYPEGYLSGDRPKETKLVEAKTGQHVDINQLTNSMGYGNSTDGRRIAKEQVERSIADRKKAGELIEVEQTKLQGAKKIKERAKAQAKERRRTTGS